MTRRKSFGLQHMMMIAPASDARRVAVVAYDQVPDDAAIFTIDLASDLATRGPPHRGTQLFPRWIDNDTLIYVELTDKSAWLMRWSLGETVSHKVARLEAPRSIFDAQNMLASIPNPLAPDLANYAYYDLINNRIRLAQLAQGRDSSLAAKWHSGAWWGPDWFVAASREEVRLVSAPARESNTSTREENVTLRLIPGRWAPLWSDYKRGSILLVGQSDRLDRFVLLQIWIIADRDTE